MMRKPFTYAGRESKPVSSKFILRAVILSGAALALAGCQTFSPDGGMSPIAKFTGSQLGKDVTVIKSDEDAAAARSAVERLLKRPLTADAAVQIALLNNRGLQAAYNELAIAEAGKVGASLPHNPVVSLSRMSGGGEVEIERKIVADILSLATLPLRADIAADRFRQAQLRAIAETMRVAIDTKRAYYRAVAARQAVASLEQAQSAAGTANTFAKRLGESGAMSKLDQAREQVFFADITSQVASARQRAASNREQLTRALGLWGADVNFKLARALPALPARPKASRTVEADAIRRRVDLQIARIEVEALAKSNGLTQATRFINLLDVAGVSKTTRSNEGTRTRQQTLEVEFQIPLFDFGEVRAREAEQTYREAVNRLIEKAVNVRSEARDAYRGYRAAYDIAAHYQREVLPLRKLISDETQLSYNAMQIDVFSLLTEARQRIAARVAAIDAQREFWLADANLTMATTGGSPAGGGGDAAGPMLAAAGGTAGH
jgi:outer membrane protein TolC